MRKSRGLRYAMLVLGIQAAALIGATYSAQAQVGMAEVGTSKQVSTLRAAMESLIDRVRQDIRELQNKVADHNNRINQNATNISTNTNSINGLRNDVNHHGGLIGQLRNELNLANNEISLFKNCANREMIYAPLSPSRDAQGCIKPTYRNCGNVPHGQIVISNHSYRSPGETDHYAVIAQCFNGDIKEYMVINTSSNGNRSCNGDCRMR